MRTVKELREELSKFPDDCVCFAYEGEVTGIIIERPAKDGRRNMREQGVIHCGERNQEEGKTTLLPDAKVLEGDQTRYNFHTMTTHEGTEFNLSTVYRHPVTLEIIGVDIASVTNEKVPVVPAPPHDWLTKRLPIKTSNITFDKYVHTFRFRLPTWKAGDE